MGWNYWQKQELRIYDKHLDILDGKINKWENDTNNENPTLNAKNEQEKNSQTKAIEATRW